MIELELHGHESATPAAWIGQRDADANLSPPPRLASRSPISLGACPGCFGSRAGEVRRDRGLDAGRRVRLAEVLEQHRHRQHRRRRVGLALAGDVGRRAVHRLEHRRVGAAHVEVAARGEADAAGDRGRQVGDDVAEQVVGDDHVVAAGVGDQVDRRRVDVVVGGRDVGELGGDRVRTCGTRGRRRMTSTLFLWTSVRCLRGRAWARPNASRTTRSTPKAVLTLTSVAISCGVPLRSTPPLPVYGPSVPSRTTTKSIGGLAGQRRSHPRVELGRAQVHVVVEFEAQPQQQAALEHAGRDRSGRRPRRAGSRRGRAISSSTESGSVSPVRCQRAAPRSYGRPRRRRAVRRRARAGPAR